MSGAPCWLTPLTVGLLGVARDFESEDPRRDFAVEISDAEGALSLDSTASEEPRCEASFVRADAATMAAIGELVPETAFSDRPERSADGAVEVFSPIDRERSAPYLLVISWRARLTLVEGQTSAAGASFGTFNRLRAAVVRLRAAVVAIAP